MKKRSISMINTGCFIQEKRSGLNYTQDKLANELGITKTAVSNWENGISMVDVKYLVPLANIFSVTVDEILFPNKNELSNPKYSDITKQFQNMMELKTIEPGLCIKLIESYIECKIRIVKQLKKYKETKDDSIIDEIIATNILGFAFGDFEPLNKNDIINDILRNEIIEDNLCTVYSIFSPLCAEINPLDNETERQIPRLFIDEWIFEREVDEWFGSKLNEISFLANLIFYLGNERIFRKLLGTFSKEYRNKMLFNLIRKNEIINPKGDFDKQTLKAIKWMLKSDAAYWVNGENRTEELMKKVL